jgi:pimeloyl-ACP methyl ester carboxylesterase
MKRIILPLILLASSFSVMAKQSPEFAEAWNAYAKKAESRGLQENCKPRWYKAKEGVDFKGTIVLHHGFTACPQQFFEISERYLVPAGYDVLLTVLPGHGGKWDEKNHDDYEALMGRNNFEQVTEEFVEQINAVMEKAAGEKIAGGLSIGSEFAYDSVLRKPGLYSRLIMVSPFFRLSTDKKEFEPGKHLFLKILQAVAGPINRSRPKLIDNLADPKPPLLLRPFKGFKNSRSGWGEGCSVTERNGGRAGTCEFSLDKISAIQKYGERLVNEDVPTDLKIQFIGVRKDPTASVKDAYALFEKMREENQQVSFCLAPSDVNHSMLSRYDSPTENKYWMEDALKEVSSFIITGEHTKSEEGEKGYPNCSGIKK